MVLCCYPIATLCVLLLVNLSCSTCSNWNKQCNCRSRCRSVIHCFLPFSIFFLFRSLVLPSSSHLINLCPPPTNSYAYFSKCQIMSPYILFSLFQFYRIWIEWAQIYIYIYINIYMNFLLAPFCYFFTICFVELIIQAKAWLSKLSYMETLYQWRLWNCNSCGFAF